jgi:hypothetical protein
MSEDAEEKKNHNLCQSIEDKDIYKYVLDTRNFEISLFWQRSNYFLVLNSALAVGFFSLKSTKFMYLLAALDAVVTRCDIIVASQSQCYPTNARSP